MEYINFDERKLIKNIIVITFFIVFLNIANMLLGEPSWQITRLIDVGYESNFPHTCPN